MKKNLNQNIKPKKKKTKENKKGERKGQIEKSCHSRAVSSASFKQSTASIDEPWSQKRPIQPASHFNLPWSP